MELSREAWLGIMILACVTPMIFAANITLYVCLRDQQYNNKTGITTKSFTFEESDIIADVVTSLEKQLNLGRGQTLFMFTTHNTHDPVYFSNFLKNPPQQFNILPQRAMNLLDTSKQRRTLHAAGISDKSYIYVIKK